MCEAILRKFTKVSLYQMRTWRPNTVMRTPLTSTASNFSSSSMLSCVQLSPITPSSDLIVCSSNLLPCHPAGSSLMMQTTGSMSAGFAGVYRCSKVCVSCCSLLWQARGAPPAQSSIRTHLLVGMLEAAVFSRRSCLSKESALISSELWSITMSNLLKSQADHKETMVSSRSWK